MRGGLVARLGAPSSEPLDALADLLLRHRGSPRSLDSGPFQVRALVDEEAGPFLESSGGRVRVAHGAPPAGLEEMMRTASRFTVLEWDGRVLRIARDAFGQVPLLHRMMDGALWLSTEVRPLLALGRPAPDIPGLAALAAGVRDHDFTGWTGIRKVLPGTILEVDARLVMSTTRWWRPEKLLETHRGTRDEAIESFRERFGRAVSRCRQPSDSVLMSGGLDSSSVALEAASLPGPRPALVHVSHPTVPSVDEVPYATAVSSQAGCELACVPGDLSPWSPQEELEEHRLALENFPVGIFDTGVRWAAGAGLRTMLDGTDGDSVVGRAAGMLGRLALQGRLDEVARAARAFGTRRVVRHMLAELLPPTLRLTRLRRRPPPMRETPYFSGWVRERVEELNRWHPPRTAWRREEVGLVTPPMTVRLDEIEMIAARHDIDIRHPFQDIELVRLLVSLPFAHKTDPLRTKSFLRDAMADRLPPLLANRPRKTTFEDVVAARLDREECLDIIRGSGCRLPCVDYRRIFEDAQTDPDRVPQLVWIRLTRAHVLAASA